MTGFPCLTDLPTPCLLIDRDRMRSNIRRMAAHIGGLGPPIRPHVKTHKSHEVLREIVAGGNTQGITVSTLKEAEYFLQMGEQDILYAVGIVPGKLDAIAALMAQGARIKVILDSVEAARQVAAKAKALSISLPVLVELDVDRHRSGVDPAGEDLVSIAREIAGAAPALLFKGVMTHAGESYHARSEAALRQAARNERDAAVAAATRLRTEGFSVEEVSIGSTPSALFYEDLSGVTEVRVGVYVFFDLVMAGVGVCSQADIALSVLATIIGHQAERNWAICDAGWMAMSRDRGTSRQEIDQGYGVVLGADGAPLGDMIVARTNQEHGILESRDVPARPLDLKLGDRVRILPNHACSTASQYDCYYVIEKGRVIAHWFRINGW